MSSIIRNIQKRKKLKNKEGKRMDEMIGKDVRDKLNKGRANVIDFETRALPNAILVDVQKGTFRFGEEGKLMRDITEIHDFGNINSEIQEKLDMLKVYRDDGSVTKVVLNDVHGFKFRTLTEFIDELETFMATGEKPKNTIIGDTEVIPLEFSDEDRINIDTEVTPLTFDDEDRIDIDILDDRDILKTD